MIKLPYQYKKILKSFKTFEEKEGIRIKDIGFQKRN